MTEAREFWSTSLPLRILFFISYVAVSVCLLVRFWRPPIDWGWWLLLAACAFTWIRPAAIIARELRSLRRPPKSGGD